MKKGFKYLLGGFLALLGVTTFSIGANAATSSTYTFKASSTSTKNVVLTGDAGDTISISDAQANSNKNSSEINGTASIIPNGAAITSEDYYFKASKGGKYSFNVEFDFNIKMQGYYTSTSSSTISLSSESSAVYSETFNAKKAYTISCTNLTSGTYTFATSDKEFDVFEIYLTSTTAVTTPTITYNTNGGSEVASKQSSTIVFPDTDPTKDGFTFEGWYTDSDLTVPASAGTEISTDTTLYAKWTAVATTYTYTVNYDYNYSSKGTFKTDSAKSTETTYTFDVISETPTRSGYNFLGWTESSTSSALVDSVTCDTENLTKTLYAVWEEGYTVSYELNGHGTAISSVTGTTTLPATLPTPVATNYEFGGWYTDSALTVSATAGAAITENTILYAKWTYNGTSVDVSDIVDVLNPSNVDTATGIITDTVLSSKYTYLGGASQKLDVIEKETKITVDGASTTVTKYLKLNNSVVSGTGAGAIKFTATNNGKLVVIAKCSSKEKNRVLTLYNSSFEAVSTGSLTSTVTTYTFDVSRGVTYYLGTDNSMTGGGWYLYYMSLTCPSLNKGQLTTATEATGFTIKFQYDSDKKENITKLRIIGEIYEVNSYNATDFKSLKVLLKDPDSEKLNNKTVSLKHLYRSANDYSLGGTNSLMTVLTINNANNLLDHTLDVTITIEFNDGSILTVNRTLKVGTYE